MSLFMESSLVPLSGDWIRSTLSPSLGLAPLLASAILFMGGVLALHLARKRASQLRWRIILVIGGICALCMSAWACNLAIPFSFSDTKVWHARHLRDDVKGWGLMGRPQLYGRTNTSSVCYLASSNIVCEGHSYTSVMRLDSDALRDHGYMLATEDQKVFWIDVKGHVEILR